MHHHPQKTEHSHNHLQTAFWLNTAFALVEFAGGIATGSFAVLSNAVHDLGDSLALSIAWYFQRISNRKRDEVFSFGYKRFSVLGALINSLILLSGSCIILVESIPRIYNPQPVHATGMLLLSVLGISVNSFALFRVKKGETQNEKVISIHFLEDVLGWSAVLIASVILKFYDVPVIDPLLSVGITLFILFRLYGSLRKTFSILLQGIPHRDQAEEIRKQLLMLPVVSNLHDLHLWTLDGSYHVATLHLEVTGEMSLEETELLKSRAREILHKLGIGHTTLEIERQGQACIMNDC